MVLSPERPAEPILRVSGLHKTFPVKLGFFKRGAVSAVDGVTFDVYPGETLGIGGESGCGKSTTARLVLRLIDSDSGEVLFDGVDVRTLRGAGLKQMYRGVQMVFQDPYFPHQMSGGQLQRVNIARALALEPKLVICDEPVSALDKSIQAQVLNLLKDLQHELNLTYVFISHDLNVVEYMSDRVMVMYLGQVVEACSSEKLYREPLHPYTRVLLSSIPKTDPDERASDDVPGGEIPS